MSNAVRHCIQVTAEEDDDELSGTLELDDRGYVLREILLDSRRDGRPSPVQWGG